MLKNMNKNFFAGLFVGLGLLAIVAFKPAATEQPTPLPQKWEYHRIIAQDPKVADAQLKVAGLQGWELVSTQPTGHYFFKRPVQ